MNAGAVIALVVGILVANAILWVGVALVLRRAMAGKRAALTAELAAANEPMLRGPESAVYRGSTHGSIVKGNGVAALTATRLVFRPLIGRPIDVARDQIAAIREDKWFLRAYTGGRLHTILKLKDGSEIGFFFTDPAAWRAALGH